MPFSRGSSLIQYWQASSLPLAPPKKLHKFNYKVVQIIHNIPSFYSVTSKKQLSDNIKYHDYLGVIRGHWGKKGEEGKNSRLLRAFHTALKLHIV